MEVWAGLVRVGMEARVQVRVRVRRAETAVTLAIRGINRILGLGIRPG